MFHVCCVVLFSVAYATDLSPSYSSDVTLTVAGSPYRLTRNTQISSTATLFIETGTELQFYNDYILNIYGGIQIGNCSEITTSTNIYIHGSGTINIQDHTLNVSICNTHFKDMDTAIKFSHVDWNSQSPDNNKKIFNNNFTKCGRAIWIDSSQKKLKNIDIKNNHFKQNSQSISIEGATDIGVINNDFVNGNGRAIYLFGSQNIDVINNTFIHYNIATDIIYTDSSFCWYCNFQFNIFRANRINSVLNIGGGQDVYVTNNHFEDNEVIDASSGLINFYFFYSNNSINYNTFINNTLHASLFSFSCDIPHYCWNIRFEHNNVSYNNMISTQSYSRFIQISWAAEMIINYNQFHHNILWNNLSTTEIIYSLNTYDNASIEIKYNSFQEQYNLHSFIYLEYYGNSVTFNVKYNNFYDTYDNIFYFISLDSWTDLSASENYLGSHSNIIDISLKFNDNCNGLSQFHITFNPWYLTPITINNVSNLPPLFTSNDSNIDIYCATNYPTTNPTYNPSLSPTQITISPTNNPTVYPTTNPTKYPTLMTLFPTNIPTSIPTFHPTILPTIYPTVQPTIYPTKQTIGPSVQPTVTPTNVPTSFTNSPTKVIQSTLEFMNMKENNDSMNGGIIAIIIIGIVIGLIILIIIYCKCCRKRTVINQFHNDIHYGVNVNGNTQKTEIYGTNATETEKLPNWTETQMDRKNIFDDIDKNDHVELVSNNKEYKGDEEENIQSVKDEIKQWFVNEIDINDNDALKYFNLLINNGFDNWTSIKYVTKDDLQQLGIKLGHIVCILKAIENVDNNDNNMTNF